MDEFKYFAIVVSALLVWVCIVTFGERLRLPARNAARTAQASAWLKEGRVEEALGVLEKCLSDARRLLGAEHAETQQATVNLKDGQARAQCARGSVAPTSAPYDDADAPLPRDVLTGAILATMEPGWQDRMKGADMTVNDGFLHTYWDADVSWERIRFDAESHSMGQGIPLFEMPPYWVRSGPGGAWVPISRLAFCVQPTRLRIAQDPDTPAPLLTMMASDWDPEVGAAASRSR